jgi:hypothetical protein
VKNFGQTSVLPRYFARDPFGGSLALDPGHPIVDNRGYVRQQ